MATNKLTNDSFSFYLKRSIDIIREEGLLFLLKRFLNILRPNFRKTHLLVFNYKIPADFLDIVSKENNVNFKENSFTPLSDNPLRLAIKKISEKDDPDIDALTEIDEWKIPKSATLKDLNNKSHGYIVKINDEIVATGWATQANEYYDFHLKRKFLMANNESYFWRGFCIPSHRGRNIIGYLTAYMMKDLEMFHGKNSFLILVRNNNNSIIKASNKFGWSKAGHAGFIEAFGIRFHFLIGSNAFKNTKKRFFLQKN